MASSTAPTDTAASATLKVQKCQVPKRTSMKSTTPRADRNRSIRLPNAPPDTKPNAVASQTSDAAARRYMPNSTTSATTTTATSAPRPASPPPIGIPNAVPGLYVSVNCTMFPSSGCAMCAGSRCVTASTFVIQSAATTNIASGQYASALGGMGCGTMRRDQDARDANAPNSTPRMITTAIA